MINKVYQEYLEITVSVLKNWTDQGYELIQIYSENNGYIQDKQIYGSFMGNNVTLTVPVYTTVVTTKALLGRTNAARILYEEKLNAIKSGNS